MKNITIAIDGPAGAGKSTVAKRVSEVLSIEYVDTGAMYRALTLKVLQLHLDPKLKEDIIRALEGTNIDFIDNHIYLDGKLVDKAIRDNLINKNVWYIAKVKEVRDFMVEIQKQLSKNKSIVMEGRDIGSIVLPDADFKFFIVASVEERARRRYKELLEKGESGISLEQIQSEIENRDNIDSTRDISPLIQSEDAFRLDTTNITIEETVDKIVSIVQGR